MATPTFIILVLVAFSAGRSFGLRCPRPEPVENGRSILKQRGFVVVYYCYPPARMSGYRRALCAGTRWTHEAPKCILPTPKPDSGKKVYISPETTKQPSTTAPKIVKNTAFNTANNNVQSQTNEDGSSSETPPLNDDIFSQHIRQYRVVYKTLISNAIHAGDIARVAVLKKKHAEIERYLLNRRKTHYQILKQRQKIKLGGATTTTPAPEANATVDKCRVNNGGCAHICKSMDGELSCSCNPGYMLVASDGVSCEDINECSPNFGRGPCSGKCENTEGSFTCVCTRRGTKLAEDGKTCSDINECEINNHGCSHICTNAYGTAFCSCPTGFFLKGGGKICEDIDECGLPSTKCDGKCVNTLGAYDCIEEATPAPTEPSNSNDCYISGLRRDKYGFCVDINECEDNNYGCSHQCLNFYGSAFCACPRGFRKKDSKTCEDVNECDTYYGRLCTFGCINLIGSYRCACPPGFKHYGTYCEDINECAINNGGCSHTCVNQRGNMECRCPSGFELLSDDKTCRDINECELKNPCHHLCINFDGGYKCGCKPGYLLLYNDQCTACRRNSYMLQGQDSCEECPSFSHTNGEGKTSRADCICNSGFDGDLSSDDFCTDINECANQNFNCSNDCVNTPGDAHCTCPDGYELDKDWKTCIDADECAFGNGGCGHRCTNLLGSYECSCFENYVQDVNDKNKCLDIDECEVNNGGCSHICNNFNGGYHCRCDENMRLSPDLKTCIDVVCADLPLPANSKISCNGQNETSDTILYVNIECNVECNKGYELIGEPVLTCLSNGSWSHFVPYCSALTCPILVKPENGNVLPASCHEGETPVTKKCYYTCNTGFVLIGKPAKKCLRTQAWYPQDSPICQEHIPEPFIQCPEDIVEFLESGKDSKNVHVPKPISNMIDSNVISDPKWVTDPSAKFPAGITEVTFIALNPNSNQTASCITSIYVKDVENPKVKGCPASFEVEAEGTKTVSVNWTEPIFEDNVGIERLWKSNDPGSHFGDGIHTITYSASDAAGNQVECTFSVTLKRRSCPILIGPANGGQNCMDWLYGQICQPNCKESYMWYNETMYAKKPYLYTCGADAIWKPGPIIPDCVEYKKMNDSSSSCLLGNERRSTKNGEICVQCPAGMYSAIPDSFCRQCPQNYYSNEFATVKCKECPNGFVTVSEGSTSINDCVERLS